MQLKFRRRKFSFIKTYRSGIQTGKKNINILRLQLQRELSKTEAIEETIGHVLVRLRKPVLIKSK